MANSSTGNAFWVVFTWHGDEMVLDMGCGRGAVLTAVARRLTTGRATGVTSGVRPISLANAKEVALRNASLEGVSERVHIETADTRALPFSDKLSTWSFGAWRYAAFVRMPIGKRAIAEAHAWNHLFHLQLTSTSLNC